MPLAGPAPATARVELSALLRLAAPLVGANLLQMGVYAVDVMFVARLSAVDFAASTLGVFLLSLVMWALIGMTGACAPIIAAELGARAHAVRQVRRSFRMAMWLGLLAGLVAMGMLAFGRDILLALGQDPRVAARTGAFLDILLWVMLPNLWAGVGLVRGGAGTALVGDPEQVAARMQEYVDLGIDTFILSGYPHLEEAYRFAELVFPLLPRSVQEKLPGRILSSPFGGEVIANHFVPQVSAS